MIGDTWIAPNDLFDPATDTPPADAYDVQYRVPISLAAYADELAREHRDAELAEFIDIYHVVIAETVRFAQRWGGAIASLFNDEIHLSITPVVEMEVPGLEGLHPHAHLYIGAHGIDLHDGSVREVPRSCMDEGAKAWTVYQRKLHTETRERLAAIREDELYVFTHAGPEWRSELEGRFAAILSAMDRAAAR